MAPEAQLCQGKEGIFHSLGYGLLSQSFFLSQIVNNTVFSSNPFAASSSVHSQRRTMSLAKPRCSQSGGCWPVWPSVIGEGPFSFFPHLSIPNHLGVPSRKLTCSFRSAGPLARVADSSRELVQPLAGDQPCKSLISTTQHLVYAMLVRLPLSSIVMTLLARRDGERIAKVNNQVSATGMICACLFIYYLEAISSR